MPNHLTVEERDRLAQRRYEKATQREMARALGRSASTVSRELRRNSTGSDYYAGLAQRKAEERRRERPLTRKMDDPQLNAAVRARVGAGMVPATDCGPTGATGGRPLRFPRDDLCLDQAERASPALGIAPAAAW